MYWFTPPKLKFLRRPLGAIVAETITPQTAGRVTWQGTTWHARFYRNESVSKHPGHLVTIIGRKGNTLLVLSKVQQLQCQDAYGRTFIHSNPRIVL